MTDKYLPEVESLKEHQLPTWYDKAKLGIFIHWGIYSVPAWAPTTGELGDVDWEVWFKNNPYAEWYQNSLRIENSSTQEYHKQKYGNNFKYEDFIELWQAENWDPDEWVELFKNIGARYVVLTTKHHDGFNLWPSKYTDFSVKNKGPKKDIVGNLTKSVRKYNLKMGLYYSGVLDWRYTEQPITHPDDLNYIYPHTYSYADYAYNQWKELINQYQPDILWNDIGWPEQGEDQLNFLISYYYNKISGGVINDRWQSLKVENTEVMNQIDWGDYQTAEYFLGRPDKIANYKWEMCRGLSYSFGYNQNEKNEHTESTEELVQLLVDVVSKNGNLLLNIGPKADGTIPKIQKERLISLGKWLDFNGEAIFGTSPWVRAEGFTEEGIKVRFTCKEDKLYIILLSKPEIKEVKIKSLYGREGIEVKMLGVNKKLNWKQNDCSLTINLPQNLPDLPVETYVLKVSNKSLIHHL